MFCDYINELQAIKGLPGLGRAELQESYRSYVEEPSTEWIDIFTDETTTVLAGFLIVGYPPNCHPHADFYIEESYIEPEYRRQGRMTLAVSQFIEAHEGVYCLFIIHKNEPALRFWPKIFQEHGYVPIELSDVGAGDQYCKQYGFRKLDIIR